MERFTARSQLTLAMVTLVAFIGLAYILVLNPVALEAETRDFLEKILAALVVIVTQQSSYFFARQRPNGDSAPIVVKPDEPAPAISQEEAEARAKDTLAKLDQVNREIAEIGAKPAVDDNDQVRLDELIAARKRVIGALAMRLAGN